MTVLEAIRTKRATRQFADKPISEEDARTILEAGRHAQSAINSQPWHFIAVRDKKLLGQLADVSGHAGHLKGAALGVFLLVKPGKWSPFDGGQAAAYLQLAGWERGIGSCLGSFADGEDARRLLGYPADLELLISISFGFPVSQTAPPPKKGGRRTLDEVAHWEKW